jgi:hypothetical protein
VDLYVENMKRRTAAGGTGSREGESDGR